MLITKAMNIYSGEVEDFTNFVADNLADIDVSFVINAASYSRLSPFAGGLEGC